jgi:tetratricopeptide (TPR) repeat protein
MDAVQFGRWISERRRAAGWSSQRALAGSARRHPLISKYRITEDFLARLEAGHFVHPFRGSVRQRVLALTCLICKTPRDVRVYLQTAELTELNDEETRQMHWLNKHLFTKRSPTMLPLPPRPLRLFGRDTLLESLIRALSSGESGLYALTGMVGVGKSALAYEALHRLAFSEKPHLRAFPDGIATFTGTGRQGTGGLLALLNEVAAAFSPTAPPAVRSRQVSALPTLATVDPAVLEANDEELKGAINRVRTALAEKRVLLLLDDLDSQFPLRQALDVLLTSDQDHAGSDHGHGYRILLTTSRYIPAPSVMAMHFHITPLEPGAALDLLAALLGRPLSPEERADAQRLCAAVGYLPLALEVAATAMTAKGIPVALLAAHAAEQPLDTILDDDGELRAVLTQALGVFDPEMQQRFALLSVLGVRSFRLEMAAAIGTSPEALWVPEHGEAVSLPAPAGIPGEHASIALPQLVSTAADLGQFVRHSLLELAPGDELPTAITPRPAARIEPRYRVHPLLHAYTRERALDLPPDIVDAAQRNILGYALAYVEHCHCDIILLERERDFLLAALTQAWQRDQYQQVVRLVDGLICSAGRLGDYEVGERILRLGIQASRQLHDQVHLARFMNRLGILFFYKGELDQAKQLWEECLDIARSLNRPGKLPICLWFPLANLALIPGILGDYDAARQSTETYLQHAQDIGDPILLAHALSTRGVYARLRGERTTAYDDLRFSLYLLSLQYPYKNDDSLMMEVKTEFARAQGDYIRAQESTDMLLSLMREKGDRYNIPGLLYDQAYFAHQQGVFDDARTLAQQAAQLAEQVRAPQLHKRSMALLQQIPGDTLS